MYVCGTDEHSTATETKVGCCLADSCQRTAAQLLSALAMQSGAGLPGRQLGEHARPQPCMACLKACLPTPCSPGNHHPALPLPQALEEGLTCQQICDKYHAIHKARRRGPCLAVGQPVLAAGQHAMGQFDAP